MFRPEETIRGYGHYEFATGCHDTIDFFERSHVFANVLEHVERRDQIDGLISESDCVGCRTEKALEFPFPTKCKGRLRFITAYSFEVDKRCKVRTGPAPQVK